MSMISLNSYNTYNNNLNSNNKMSNQPSFKGNAAVKKPSTFISLSTRAALGINKLSNFYNEKFIDNILAKKLIAPMMNSKIVGNIAEKTAKVEKMPDYMATTGSCITTLTYAGTTLHKAKKKELEKKPAYTLALNQILVTVLSTVGAFTINDGIAGATKKLSYKFRDLNQNHPRLENRMAGFKIAQKLLTFSLMYRYVAPVLVTPVASKIGKALNGDAPKTKKTTQPIQPTQPAIVKTSATKILDNSKFKQTFQAKTKNTAA